MYIRAALYMEVYGNRLIKSLLCQEEGRKKGFHILCIYNRHFKKGINYSMLSIILFLQSGNSQLLIVYVELLWFWMFGEQCLWEMRSSTIKTVLLCRTV